MIFANSNRFDKIAYLLYARLLITYLVHAYIYVPQSTYFQPKNRRRSHSQRPQKLPALPSMKSIKQPTKFPRFQRKPTPVLVTPKPFHPNPFSGIQRLQLPFKSRSPSKAAHRVTKMPYFTIGHVPRPITTKGFRSSQGKACLVYISFLKTK